MTAGIAWLRRMVVGSDEKRAAARETAIMRAATFHDAVDPRFRSTMASHAAAPRSIILGRSPHDSSLTVVWNPQDLLGRGHALVLGSTGGGKTRLLLAILRALLLWIAMDPDAPRLWIEDHKGDLVALVEQVIAELADALPTEARNRLLDALVVINPFSTEALVPLQILAREPGSNVPPEVQAYEVATLFERMAGDLGVRQDALLFHLLLLGITRGMSLPELPALLGDPIALAAAASSSPHPDVRRFFSEGIRLQAGSVDGLRARFTRLLRLPSTRLMLGASRSIDFRALLRSKITLVDLGAPPLGCEDLARWWSGLVTLKLTRAIFERTADEAARPALVAIDEWQEGLAGGTDVADGYERLLSMARSKGIALCLTSQSLAGAARVSASLPKVVATNTVQQFLFRASIDDARAMAHLLPVTGKRLRPAPPPWEARRGNPYLSPQEEIAALVEEVAHLPDRTFYYWDRRQPYRAQLVRAADVEVHPLEFLPTEVAHRIRNGTAAVPMDALEREARARGGAGAEFAPVGDGIGLGPARRRRGGGAR